MKILIYILIAVGLVIWALARFFNVGGLEGSDAIVFIGLAMILGIFEKRKNKKIEKP